MLALAGRNKVSVDNHGGWVEGGVDLKEMKLKKESCIWFSALWRVLRN